MNTRLLRMAPRLRHGVRVWSVPGFAQHFKVVPPSKSNWPGTHAVYWPGPDCIRGARFDWHHKVIRNEIRKALNSTT